VTGAKKDGIHCQQYFLMSSGELNINGVEDDGIQVELKDTVQTGILKDHEDENSGNFYMSGGSLSINNLGGYCIKTVGSIAFSGGKQLFDTNNIKDYATTAILQPRTTLDDAQSPVQVYDLQGRRMPHDAMLPRGIYIVKEGGKTRKMTMK
jgi:hypothetical protein